MNNPDISISSETCVSRVELEMTFKIFLCLRLSKQNMHVFNAVSLINTDILLLILKGFKNDVIGLNSNALLHGVHYPISFFFQTTGQPLLLTYST